MSAERPYVYRHGEKILGPDGQQLRQEVWQYRFEWRGELFKQGGFATKAKAEEAEAVARRALRDGLVDDLRRAIGKRTTSVGDLLDAYEAAGCPDRHDRVRVGTALTATTSQVAALRRWWGKKNAATITQSQSLEYWDARKVEVRSGTGDRTTELELQALKMVFQWAARRGKITKVPEIKMRFRDPKQIRHARECMPASAAELHRIATVLLANPRSAALGWAYLLQAFTGLRYGEVQLLLANAKRDDITPEPGYCDDRYFHVKRIKGGCNPRVRLDDPERPQIRALIERIKKWRLVRRIESRWLIPGRMGDAIEDGSLTKCLGRAVAALKIKGADGELVTRTSHGARAYYVSVRLAQGGAPDDVAREVGQGSGDDLVRDVYGMDPDDFCVDNWRSLADRYTWLPTGEQKPAWEGMESATNIIEL